MRPDATHATFTLRDAATSAEVLGESRTIPVGGVTFEDDFDGYAVHLYKLAP
jgi:hypothetical protein